MKCCSSFIELIRGSSTKCDLATNTNNSSKRQSTKMSFTLQRDRENWVQIDGDLIDRSTGWLVGGLTCSLASMSIKISWGPIDLHKIAHCQTISLRIRSHLDKCAKSRAFFLLIFFPSHFCRRRSHQFLLLFINSFTTTPFFLCSSLNSKANSDFDWRWLFSFVFTFLVAQLHFHTSHFTQGLLFFPEPRHLHGYPTCSADLMAVGVSADLLTWLMICVNFLVSSIVFFKLLFA